MKCNQPPIADLLHVGKGNKKKEIGFLNCNYMYIQIGYIITTGPV